MKPSKLFVTAALSVAVVACLSRSASAATTIQARVAPVRIMVVSAGKIIRIDSNTTQDVTPSVVSGSTGGPRKAMTPALRFQYVMLKRHIDFSRAGMVYRRPTNSLSWLVRQWQQFRTLAFGA